MAKWGEGDPRWIVEERPDAVNVNNWHWTEKNACGWSDAKFKELFIGYEIKNELFSCKITGIEKCQGEAVANNRKGKLIFFYEWEITLKWKGKINGSEEYITGQVIIPNLSEENSVDEVDVNVYVTETTVSADVMKDAMREYGSKKIREQLQTYIQDLKAEFSQGMILPKKDGDSAQKDTINSLSSGFEAKVQMNHTPKQQTKTKSVAVGKDAGVKLDVTTLEINESFQCTAQELYNALTVNEMLIAFTHGPVKLDLRKGGEFELFGGNIHGQFLELVPASKIVQTWRYKRWPSAHFSTVTMNIVQQTDHTELNLTQTDVPASEAEITKENWERYYWESLKRTFGFGYFM